MPQVYFLCTGNACRSQMAEGFAKKLFGSDWQIASAGIEAHGLNPLAVQVMAEKGIDISQQRSKVIDPDYLMHADLVVTLWRCTRSLPGHAAKRSAPTLAVA